MEGQYLKYIKKGFFIGIGLLMPMALLEFGAFKLSMVMMTDEMESYTEKLDYQEEPESDWKPGEKDIYDFNKSYVGEVLLGEYSYTTQGLQLLITGDITNKSSSDLSVVEVEAELFNKDGKFVYECSEYMRKQFKSGAKENYLIKCGCSKNGLPEFDKIEVRVVNASTL